MIGLYIGILVITCLLVLITVLSVSGKEKAAEAESAGAEAVRPLYLPVSEGETVTFFITRREIAEDARRLGDPDITVSEYPCQPQLPTTLKYRGRTYAMLYATDNGVLIIARLDNGYAEELVCKYPGIRHAAFPRGANWYCVPVGRAFTDKEEVYRILFEARAFLPAAGGRNEPAPSHPKSICSDGI